ncbi:MAG: prepilin-type N-terminal cleavage/methylation domain-containing protein, partial [Chitinivibrionales bacterium]|nr:prepilin-type N-terminal cleavage/methylation domain-containing protein [Chitinivibrionales bacterium]MBD3395138.1 prepilin-type N-terminal cleavage/methylation domain-containing protein [Chitinivibrionales bacterium]
MRTGSGHVHPRGDSMHTPHKKHQGVTLVEVIVVAVIVGILAVVA